MVSLPICTGPNISLSIHELDYSRMLERPHSSECTAEPKQGNSLGHEVWHQHQVGKRTWQCQAEKGDTGRETLPMWSAGWVGYDHSEQTALASVSVLNLWLSLCLVFFTLRFQRRTHFYTALTLKTWFFL